MKVKVKHSESKSAFNIVGDVLGAKYKIARIPYVETPHNKPLTLQAKKEAFNHAEFIAFCFNNSDKIQKENERFFKI